jgi:hypothetical protein
LHLVKNGVAKGVKMSPSNRTTSKQPSTHDTWELPINYITLLKNNGHENQKEKEKKEKTKKTKKNKKNKLASQRKPKPYRTKLNQTMMNVAKWCGCGPRTACEGWGGRLTGFI